MRRARYHRRGRYHLPPSILTLVPAAAPAGAAAAAAAAGAAAAAAAATTIIIVLVVYLQLLRSDKGGNEKASDNHKKIPLAATKASAKVVDAWCNGQVFTEASSQAAIRIISALIAALGFSFC